MEVEKTVKTLVANIKKHMKKNGFDSALIGISGGKNSLVAALLMREALGEKNVIGMLLPNGMQDDINDANIITNYLGIKQAAFNVLPITANYIEITFSIMNDDQMESVGVSDKSKAHLLPGVRMITLRHLANSIDGCCVVGTSNADTLGMAGEELVDMLPLGELHPDEVAEVGEYLIEKYWSGLHEGVRLGDFLTKESDEDNIKATRGKSPLGYIVPSGVKKK